MVQDKSLGDFYAPEPARKEPESHLHYQPTCWTLLGISIWHKYGMSIDLATVSGLDSTVKECARWGFPEVSNMLLDSARPSSDGWKG